MGSVKPAGVVAPPRANDGHIVDEGEWRYGKYLSQKSIRDKAVGCRGT